MSDAIPQIVESCPQCGQAVDVTGQEPFSEVDCPACGATMRARLHFNNFTLLELLGEGGMGSVFQAVDNNLQRKVALKILKRSAGSTQEEWAKLAAEARLTAAVNHPNVVKVFSFGEDHGQFYLAMELVEKGSLDGLMVLQTRVAEAQVLDIGIQIAEGLQAAFEHGLIHRDIKPGNILFANARLAKIVDFGLARVLSEEAQEAGEIWGTPFYVAPEKLDGRPEDFRSDIYSLGGTLFHALAGRPPFDARTASMVVLKHIKSQAVSLQAFAPNVSDETAYVINRMLNKSPEERYQSYEELLTHLHYARQKLQKRSAEQGGSTARRKEKTGGNGLVLGALWGVAALACLAIALSFVALRDSPRQAADPSWTFVERGSRALGEGKFDAARARFQDVLSAEEAKQPSLNWAQAQLGLAALLDGDATGAEDAFAKLGDMAFFDAAPAPQALGRFFANVAQCMKMPAAAAPSFSDGDFEAFGLLACGVAEWQAGEIEPGGAMLEKFEQADLRGADRWLAQLKPLAAPYITDYRRYMELRDAAEESAGGNSADLLARIGQAKADARTGAPIRAKLDALARTLKLD